MGKTTDSGLSKSEGGYKESVKKTLNNFPNNESILKHIFRNKDGSQVRVIVRDNNIRNAGINTTPQNWDSRTGFSKNIFKNTSWRVK